MDPINQPKPTIYIDPACDMTEDDLWKSRVFTDWYEQARVNFIIHGVQVIAPHFWGRPVETKMLHMVVDAHLPGSDENPLPGIVTLRGNTVDILTVITDTDTDTEYFLFVAQPRVAVGQAVVLSNPSGMVDTGEPALSAAMRELIEEVGGDIDFGRLVDIGWYSFNGADHGILVSPGLIDERVTFYATQASVSHAKLEELRERVAGHAAEGEQTKVVLVQTNIARMTLSTHTVLDLKTITSIMLWNEYRRQCGFDPQ